MRSLIKLFGIAAIAALTFTGCTKDSIFGLSDEVAPSNETALSAISTPTGVADQQVVLESHHRPPAIWSDCEKFATLGTNTSFKPTAGNFDELYNGAFLDGLGSISESKPGDKDYNGGRWHVNVLKESVDANKYINACSVEELDLNDFESTPTYFECPLLHLN